MAARICPHCRTRVDERRNRLSPHCLTCGCALGAPPPRFATGKSSASRSPLPWILGGLGALALLGLGAAAVLVFALSSARDTKSNAQVESNNLPAIETPLTAAPPTPPVPPPTARPRPVTKPTAAPTVPSVPVAPTGTAKPNGVADPFGKRSSTGF